MNEVCTMVPSLQRIVEEIPASGREEIVEAAEILIKYNGYIKRERALADKINRLESIRLPQHVDYMQMQSLSTEARQKLTSIRPETIAQASRIPGVSPHDVSILLVLCGR